MELREVELCEGEQPSQLIREAGKQPIEFEDPNPPSENFLTFECENFKKEDGSIAKIYNISSYTGDSECRCVDRQDIFSLVYELQKSRAGLTEDEFRIHFVLLRVAPFVLIFTTLIALFKLPSGIILILMVIVIWIGATYHFGVLLQKSFNTYDAEVVNLLMEENRNRFGHRGVTVKHLVKYEGPRALKCFLPRRSSCIRLYMPEEGEFEQNQEVHRADVTASNIEVVSFTNTSLLGGLVSKRYRRASTMTEGGSSQYGSPVIARRSARNNTIESAKASKYEDLEDKEAPIHHNESKDDDEEEEEDDFERAENQEQDST